MRFPKTVFLSLDPDGDPETVTAGDSPSPLAHFSDGEPVATYELKTVGRLSVARQIVDEVEPKAD